MFSIRKFIAMLIATVVAFSTVERAAAMPGGAGGGHGGHGGGLMSMLLGGHGHHRQNATPRPPGDIIIYNGKLILRGTHDQAGVYLIDSDHHSSSHGLLPFGYPSHGHDDLLIL